MLKGYTFASLKHAMAWHGTARHGRAEPPHNSNNNKHKHKHHNNNNNAN